MKKFFMVMFSVMILGLFSGCGEKKENTSVKKDEIQKYQFKLMEQQFHIMLHFI